MIVGIVYTAVGALAGLGAAAARRRGSWWRLGAVTGLFVVVTAGVMQLNGSNEHLWLGLGVIALVAAYVMSDVARDKNRANRNHSDES